MKARIVLLIFFVTVLFCSATPIIDADLFWHLATGRWIWEHRALPSFDPFSYTTSLKAYEEFHRAKVILTQYWLANIIQYVAYQAGGYYGIIALRLILVFLTLLILFSGLKKKGLGTLSSLVILIPLAYLLVDARGDRPNQMTFLFLALFLYLFENLRNEAKEVKLFPLFKLFNLNLSLFFLPVVMVLWANIHGGFILGAIISVIYISAELLRIALARWKNHEYTPNRPLLIVSAITVLAGLINPNGYTIVYTYLMETTWLAKSTVTEHLSPLTYVRYLKQYRFLILLLIFLGPALLSVALQAFQIRKGAQPTAPPIKNTSLVPCSLAEQILLILFMGGLSFTGIRYIPLMAITAVPVIGMMFRGKPDELLKRASRLFVPESALIFLFIYALSVWYPVTVFKKPPVGDYFPAEAVRFMKERNIKERVFNHFDWGGYLIWNFYPEKTVFIDGRWVSQKTYLTYLAVSGGEKITTADKVFTYKEILNAYNVRHILVPGVDVIGKLPSLIPLIEKDPEWKLVFYSKNCLFFTKEKMEPDYPKGLVAYSTAMSEALNRFRINPDNPHVYVSIARASIGLGRKDEAITFLEDALRIRPSLKGGPAEKALTLLTEGKDILLGGQ